MRCLNRRKLRLKLKQHLTKNYLQRFHHEKMAVSRRVFLYYFVYCHTTLYRHNLQWPQKNWFLPSHQIQMWYLIHSAHQPQRPFILPSFTYCLLYIFGLIISGPWLPSTRQLTEVWAERTIVEINRVKVAKVK